MEGIKVIALCGRKIIEFLLDIDNGSLRLDDCIKVPFQRKVVVVIKRDSLVKVTVDEDMHSCLNISRKFLHLTLSPTFVPINEVLQYLAHLLLYRSLLIC